MESFFSSLKTERTARKLHRTRVEAIAEDYEQLAERAEQKAKKKAPN